MESMHEKYFQRGTPPFDARFPNTYQSRHCWQNYADYHRCKQVKGEDYGPCRYFQRAYQALCPNEYISKWDELQEVGAFPTKR